MRRAIIAGVMLVCACSALAGVSNYYRQLTTISNKRGATNYAQDANCKGYWRMKNTTTNNEPDVVGLSPLLVSGVSSSSTDVASGYSGLSRKFSVTPSVYMYTPSDGSTDISGTSLSIVAWVKSYTTGGNGRMIVTKWGTSQQQYRLYVSSALVLTFGFSTTGTDEKTDTHPTSLTTQTWTHVAVTYDGSNTRLYVNGIVDSSPASYTNAIFDGTAQFQIGNQNQTARQWDGLIDDVAIFSRQLSSNDVWNIYINGVDGANGGND